MHQFRFQLIIKVLGDTEFLIDESIESPHRTIKSQLHVIKSALSFSQYKIPEDAIISIEANGRPIRLMDTITTGAQLTVTLSKAPEKKDGAMCTQTQ